MLRVSRSCCLCGEPAGNAHQQLSVGMRDVRLLGAGSRRNLHQQVDEVEGEEKPDELPPLSCEWGGPHPYMVSVRDSDGDHFCGGVVISENAVLTAAHCIDPRVSPKSSPRPELYIGGWDRDTPVEVSS